MDIDDSIEELFEKGYAELIHKDKVDIMLNLSGERIGDEPENLIIWGIMQGVYGGVKKPTI